MLNIWVNSVAGQGGAGDASPPLGDRIFFNSMQFSGIFLIKSYPGAPPRVGAPFSGKS